MLRADAIAPTGEGARRPGGCSSDGDQEPRGRRPRSAARPTPEAALLRGFLLGEDDRIDPATVDDFKRAGLAHLLAVSGDTVMLLALLGGMALLALAGVPLRPGWSRCWR